MVYYFLFITLSLAFFNVKGFMQPPIHKFTNLKCCIKSLLKPLFNGVLFFIYYFKKYFKPCYFISNTLKDILQHSKFVNWWIHGLGFLMSRTGYLFFGRINSLTICFRNYLTFSAKPHWPKNCTNMGPPVVLCSGV